MTDNIITDKLLQNKYKIFCEGRGYYDENNGCRIGGYRYKLEITIEQTPHKKNNRTLACIMMNPSTTFPDVEWENPDWRNKLGFQKTQKRRTVGFDSTVRNVIRMAHSKGYSKVCIFNLFPLIQPKGNEAIDKYKYKQYENEKRITGWSDKNCKEVLVAWGCTLPKRKSDKEKYINLQKKYIEIFKEKGISPVYYEWNKEKNCPYHPSMQVNSRWTKDSKDNIVPRTKNNKSEKGIIQLFIEGNKGFEKFNENYFN